MLYFLTILILLSAVAVIATATVTVLILRRRQKSLPPPTSNENPAQFQPIIQYQSIFAPSDEELRAAEAEDRAKRREMLRQKILAKAETGNFDALNEAKDFGTQFYGQVLKELTFGCDDEKFVSLCSFVEKNTLPTNAEFIARFQNGGENSLNKKDLIRLLHFAALSQSAEIFSATLDDAIKISGNLQNFTRTNLIQLAESQFWFLPQAEKTSGAGFLLKQKLAKLRLEVQEKQ